MARRLDLSHLELDSVYHQPGWTTLSTPEFRSRVDEVAGADGWVIDGNYHSQVEDLVLARADTVIWLRMPRRVVMRQVLQRTTTRVLFRRELWNGNRERLSEVFSRGPERSIVAWAWVMHGKYDERNEVLRAGAPRGQRWLVLRCRREVRGFLAALPARTPEP